MLPIRGTLFKYTPITVVMTCDSTWRCVLLEVLYLVYLPVCSMTLKFVNQIDAHVGGVNDLAFSNPNKQLCVITCGDDKTIKVSYLFLI